MFVIPNMEQPGMSRCDWATASTAETAYHDTEWGVPSRDATHLFEMLTLEGAQAGLSWSTILNKRKGYQRAFAGFDPAKVVRYTQPKVAQLLADSSIVRHRGKVESTISNARAVLKIQDEYDSLADFMWQVVEGRPKQNRWRKMADVPAETLESKQLSKLLKEHGFRFVGPTTCYALMQATGMVNDHLVSCFRHCELQ